MTDAPVAGGYVCPYDAPDNAVSHRPGFMLVGGILNTEIEKGLARRDSQK